MERGESLERGHLIARLQCHCSGSCSKLPLELLYTGNLSAFMEVVWYSRGFLQLSEGRVSG